MSDYIKYILIHSNSKVSLDKQFEASLRYSLSNNDKIEETNEPIYFVLQKMKKISMLHLINVNDINLNDPQKFYSNSFVDILQEEKNKKKSQKNLYKY